MARSTMAQMIAKTRLMIADPAGDTAQFTDDQIQDKLDEYRNDIRYESLQIAPSIVNAASTNNQASTIFADYYSAYQWWETDVVLQGNNTSTGAAWIVLTPTSSDYIVGHWTFENSVFTSGTVPGQYPPVFATGKTYDLYAGAADLLEFWAAKLVLSYDVIVGGQTFRRSQSYSALRDLAQQYRKLALPRTAKMVRRDIAPEVTTRKMRLMDSDDLVRGA